MNSSTKKNHQLKIYSINETTDFHDFLSNLPSGKYIIFKELLKDTIGRSNSNPTWGNVYEYIDNELYFKDIGLHKEYDYDFPTAAYSEKIWSIIGKNVLNNVRIPKISLVEETPGLVELISYRLLNNDKEDLIHIKDILFNKFSREEIQNQKDIFNIYDILECIKIQINDTQNYMEIEKSVLQTLLLDSITNNGDRHTHNWALVRDKLTNHYSLALYDHSSAFVDMIQEQRYFTVDGWVGSYITFNNNIQSKNLIGKNGNDIIRYISKNFPDYFNDFVTNFQNNFEEIRQQIIDEHLDINMQYFFSRLKEKENFLAKIQSKGERNDE